MTETTTELKIYGQLIKALPIHTGTSAKGTWQKQDFVIKTLGQYPQEICFTAFGKTIDHIPAANGMGTINVTVYFNPQSKLYNEKYITNLIAWKIEQ